MNDYIVLLRGINVGGKNLLPMKELKGLLQSNGFANVSTYIQSGNLILQSDAAPESKIRELISDGYGFEPEVLALTKAAFLQALANNPFAGYEAKMVHFYFCKAQPNVDLEKIDKLIADSEQVEIVGELFYLLAPDGIGRSKLAANAEACLGVSATARNLNTVNKLAEMISNSS